MGMDEASVRDKADIDAYGMPEDDEVDIDAQMAQTAPPPHNRFSSNTFPTALADVLLKGHLRGTLIALPCPALSIVSRKLGRLRKAQNAKEEPAQAPSDGPQDGTTPQKGDASHL